MALKEMGENDIDEVTVEQLPHGRRKAKHGTNAIALFNEVNSIEWPGVSSGDIPEIEAAKMFRQYFD